MDKYTIAPQVVGGVTMGAIAAWFGQVWPLIIMVIGFIILDYVSGIVAAAKNHELNSQKARDGIYKKVGFILLMTMGFALDAALAYLIANGLDITLPFNLPFGLIVCAWIIFTEVISFFENLYKYGISVPKWIIKVFQIAKDKVEKNE
jgi:toxin secretion/phage lysis holin